MKVVEFVEQQLVAAMRRSLLPHPFQARRHLEIAGAVVEHEASTCFYDVFWPTEKRVALLVARVRCGGASGAIRALCLQRLVRDLLGLELEPTAAIRSAGELYGREFHDRRFDLLLGTVDPASGALVQAAGRFDEEVALQLVDRPDPQHGRTVWLVCGDRAIAAETLPGPGAALSERVSAAVRLSGTPGSAVALILRPGLRTQTQQTFTMVNDLPAVARLIARVEAALAEAHMPVAVGDAVGVALDELLANVVSYGFVDGRRHEILVDLAFAQDAVELCIRDDGRAFDPTLTPAPDLASGIEDRAVGGLGIHFARELFDSMTHRRENGWNLLTLRKKI